eukprot:TRINITY_DN3330_c0_g1_i1.p1 TRINITY_DN3330_c0_g1~~TRINITY_DN3330_c0_g1_i1.p1  ORF type:complete len:366 (-),score=66.19 TRINITY_DN3330_c0_g1_i1:57-1154(-)
MQASLDAILSPLLQRFEEEGPESLRLSVDNEEIPPLFPTLGPLDLQLPGTTANNSDNMDDKNPMFPFKESTEFAPFMQTIKPDSPQTVSAPPPAMRRDFPIVDVRIPEGEREVLPMPVNPSVQPVKSTVVRTKSYKKKVSTPRKRKAPTSPEKKRPRQNRRPSKKQKLSNLSPFLQNLEGLNSQQLEEYKKKNVLTATEEKDFKKYLRKIKNRESAIQSRIKKRQYQEELEQKKIFLTKQNRELEHNLIKLEAQNEILKSEFVQFQKMISNSAGLSTMFAALNQRLQFAPAQKAMVPIKKPIQFGTASPLVTCPKSKKQALMILSMLIILHSHVPHLAARVSDNVDTDNSIRQTLSPRINSVRVN